MAAETLGRRWVGINLSPLAVKLVDQRLRDQHGLFGQVVARTDVPKRTDLGSYRTIGRTDTRSTDARKASAMGAWCIFRSGT